MIKQEVGEGEEMYCRMSKQLISKKNLNVLLGTIIILRTLTYLVSSSENRV